MNSVARRLLSTASAGVDRAVVAAMELRNRSVRVRAETFSLEERLARLENIRARYGAPQLVSDPEAFFPRPGDVPTRVRTVRALAWGGECVQVSWPSAFEPFDPVVGQRYLAFPLNQTAHARLYVEGHGRPAVIVVHGYMTGQWAVEERAWPIRWLQRRGLDVAIAVLPFHGIRARPGGGPPPFPGADPSFTNEGFRQTATDLRVLIDILRQRGAAAVGVMGMSLGGYTSALMATLEPGLAFAVPLIPLASVADFARDQGRLGSGAAADTLHLALEAANHVVSPFARPAVIDPRRILIVAAEGDRVTPLCHAERLARHFGAPLVRAVGGHLVQVWRHEAFHSACDMLRRQGII